MLYAAPTSFDPSSALLKSFDEQGYIILRNAISPEELQLLKDDLEPHFAARPMCHGLFWGRATTRIEGILNKSKIAQKIVCKQNILHFAKHALQEHCDHIQLHLTQGIRIHPGERAQVLHPDNAMFPMPKNFEFMVNGILALSAFTDENGATRIIPGSHLWAPDREPQPHEITYAEMQPGDLMIYRASMLHGGGANHTAEDRTGLSFSYSLGWLRQAENMYLTYPPEIAKTFAPELQELIGYQVHRPNLGWVHGQNPMTLLHSKVNAALPAEDFLTKQQNAMLSAFHDGKNITVGQTAKKIA